MDLFSQFFQENQKKFLSFAYSYTRNKAAAEDILMEAMASLWENREKWEKDSNLHALLLTIIKNKSLNYLEHEQVRMKAEEAINTHKQRELDLRISTLEACEPATIFDTEIQRIVYKTLEQLVELVDKIIYTQTDHDLSGQNACLADPQFHKGLQQTQQAAGAKSCDPGDQQCKFTEVRIIFPPALGQKTIADPG